MNDKNIYDKYFTTYSDKLKLEGIYSSSDLQLNQAFGNCSIRPHHVRHPAANYWSGLGELRKSSKFL